MKVFLLSIFPFIAACHSLSGHKNLSDHKPERQLASFKKNIDNSYLQSQADWHYLQGERKSSQNLYAESIHSFKEALIYDPTSLSIHLRLIKEYIKTGQPLNAFTNISFLLAKYPDNISLHLILGQFYKEHKMYEKALKEYNWILQRKPEHIEALFETAHIYIQMEQLKKARPILTVLTTIGTEEQLHNIHYLTAQAYPSKKKKIFHLKKALSFEPHFLKAALDLLSIYEELGQVDKGIYVLENIQKNTNPVPQIMLTIFNIYMQQQNLKKALVYLQSYSELYPTDWMAALQLSWLYSQNKNYKKAVAIVENIITIYPGISPEAYTLYASFFEQKQNFSKALQVLSNANVLFPKNVDILFYKAFIYDKLGQTGLSIKWMKKVLKINANHLSTLNHLAFTYAEQNKNLESAEQMAFKALALSPEDSYILDTLGWVLFKRGKVKEALQYLELAHKKNTLETVIVEHLAEVYYHMDMIDKSIALYKKAIRLETNEHRRKKLEARLLSVQMDV